MNLRLATPADADAIAALHSTSWRSTYATVLSPAYLELSVPAERKAIWRERLASPKANQYVVLIERNNRLAGFACAFAEEHVRWGSYLENLHVDVDFRGQGLGTALVAKVAQWCEIQAPGHGLYLSVNQDNLRAQRFYHYLGARNAESTVWNAPDGSTVPTFRFVWDSAALLAEKWQYP